MEFYRLIIKKKYLFAANTMPLRTKKTMGKETPLCIATDNGVALPCVYFVLSGIAWAAGLPVNGSESE